MMMNDKQETHKGRSRRFGHQHIRIKTILVIVLEYMYIDEFQFETEKKVLWSVEGIRSS